MSKTVPKIEENFWLAYLTYFALSIIEDSNFLGNPMEFKNFAKDQPDGQPYAHLDFDLGFGWNAKDDANDQDNGFICKKPVE